MFFFHAIALAVWDLWQLDLATEIFIDLYAEIKNLHLLLGHGRDFDKTFTEMFHEKVCTNDMKFMQNI